MFIVFSYKSAFLFQGQAPVFNQFPPNAAWQPSQFGVPWQLQFGTPWQMPVAGGPHSSGNRRNYNVPSFAPGVRDFGLQPQSVASDADSSGSEQGGSDSESDNNNNSLCFDNPTDANENSNKESSRINGFKVLFTKLEPFFPHKFRIEDSVIPYYEARHRGTRASSTNVPMLIIDPPLTNSWLDPPSLLNSDDQIKIWGKGHSFPSASSINPKKFPLAAKKACPFTVYKDDELKSFITGTPFKHIDLDPCAFDKSSLDFSGYSVSKVDAMLRPALHDSFVMDELLQMVLEISVSLEPHLKDSDLFPRVDVLMSTLELAAETNRRSGQAILASLVTNKLSLRDSVLKKFIVPPLTKVVLRGSDFKSAQLFGPLPESFRETLLHPNGREYRCRSKKPLDNISSRKASTSKFTGSSFNSRKRSSTFSLPNSKKQKGGGSLFFRGKGRKRK